MSFKIADKGKMSSIIKKKCATRTEPKENPMEASKFSR